MTAQQKITAKVSRLSVAALKDMAKKLMVDTRDEAGIVLSAVLDTLMAKMPEDKFVSFCEEMEA